MQKEPTHIPQKLIKTLQDVEFYQRSEAYRRLMIFVARVNEVISGKTLSYELTPYHKSLDKVIEAIDHLEKNMELFPPVTIGQRYGNPSYRKWHAQMEKVWTFIVLFIIFYI